MGEAYADRPREYFKPGPVTTRTLSRRAKRRFEELTDIERAEYRRWVRRWLETGDSIYDFAAAAGLDLKLLWRTWRSLHPAPANGGGNSVTGDDHHAGDMNGEQTFRQKQRAEQDQRVLRALRTAGTDTTHRDIAVRFRVSVDRVGRLAASIRDELAALRDKPEAVPTSTGEAPIAMARIYCIVDAAEIGARDCVGRQGEHGCFCPRAAFAINAIAPTVLPGTRLEDLIAKCRNTARSVLMKPAEERYLGPAREARDGKKVVLPLISEVPLPASPPKCLVVCEIEGCGRELRVNNLTGLCQEHRQKVPSRKRAGLVPDFARSAGTAGDLLQQAQQAQPATPAEPPAKEKAMPQTKTEPCKWTEEKCDDLCTKSSKSGLCARHAAMQKSRQKYVHTNGKARTPRKPRTVADVAAKHATVAGDDVVAILTAQLAATRAQAERIEKALQVLREE